MEKNHRESWACPPNTFRYVLACQSYNMWHYYVAPAIEGNSTHPSTIMINVLWITIPTRWIGHTGGTQKKENDSLESWFTIVIEC